jgi:hypothetical protein
MTVVVSAHASIAWAVGPALSRGVGIPSRTVADRTYFIVPLDRLRGLGELFRFAVVETFPTCRAAVEWIERDIEIRRLAADLDELEQKIDRRERRSSSR